MSGMELPAVEIKIWDHIIIDTFATLLFRSDLRFAIEIPNQQCLPSLELIRLERKQQDQSKGENYEPHGLYFYLLLILIC